MPRIIGAEKNLLVFSDPLTGDQLGVYYRMPTTSERQGFLNACIKRVGKKITMHHAEARLAYGMKILTGVREGDFLRVNESGEPVFMSSDESSSNYHAQWREVMQSGCADVVMALGAQVFDVQPTVSEEAEEDVQGE